MIHTIKLGQIENVLSVEFGTGDVMFHGITSQEYKYGMAFCQMPPREIGATTKEFDGMTTDEIPSPTKLIMSFTHPASVTALIHSLIELQKRMFDESSKDKVAKQEQNS